MRAARIAMWMAAVLTCCHAAASDGPRWFKVGGEIRGRGETTLGLGYVPGDRDTDYLHRIRLRLRVAPVSWLRMFAEVQDARGFGVRTRPVPASMEAVADLRQGYVEVGSEERGWAFRLGRQALIFGESRLVSTSNWGNVGPGYDAARLTWRGHSFTADVFASSVVQAVARKWDRPTWDRRLHGAYLSIPWRNGQVLEGYFFFKSDGGLQGRSALYTHGLRAAGKLRRGFDYNVEAAWQHGRIAREPLRAWASHWALGYTPAGWPARIRWVAEYNYASGDREPHDGVRQTFDHLYPTYKYATADNIGWRNIHESVTGPEWYPARGWKMRLAHRAFWLASRRDGLYTIFNTVCARNPEATSAWVGQETDFRANWQATSALQVMLGGGRVFPGEWLRQSTRGARLTYLYAMWTWTF